MAGFSTRPASILGPAWRTTSTASIRRRHDDPRPAAALRPTLFADRQAPSTAPLPAITNALRPASRRSFVHPAMHLLFLVLAVAATAVHAQLAPWRMYPATFRDMPHIHRDMEGPYASDFPQRGLLVPQLTSTGAPALYMPGQRLAGQLTAQWIDYDNSSRPVYSSASNVAISNQGHFFFDEYYMDVPGLNIAFNISLNFSLVDSARGLYKWEKPFFFPLDQLGYGKKEGYKVTDPDLPAPFRDGIYHNFWFTTELHMNFYYSGGEIFTFQGDDDLWVFVDGKLTTCDLGGIHATATCTLNLDSLGFPNNTYHDMAVFHVERHTDASYFTVTTSVKPINHPPTVADGKALTRAGTGIDITLQAQDIDNDQLTLLLVPPLPALGTAVLDKNVVRYVPRATANGTDYLHFLANDGTANSTTTGVITITVLPPKAPPNPAPIYFSTVAGQTVWIALGAGAGVVPTSDPTTWSWAVRENPDFGYASIVASNWTLRYDAVNAGNDTFSLAVMDPELGSNGVGIAQVFGRIDPAPVTPGLSPTIVAAIVIAAAAVVGIFGGLVAYFLYHKYMASKFEATWHEEWVKSNIQDNPLFVSNFKEQVNPLYQAG
ncbi:fibro-slime domain-containing protein [Allomyces macrogynus ATCC 38327]|uniref:Fibro-slime domain-containing protein n=1 Tax=Allomyces macrogynus (strain ATCC 38327) TaxID=578462 RepID=A0A0L0SH33_ALLM3|nr:fibro-slime domain-containing protein [Allomyces macrogynus ATCC 38327]|eukprot:KNE61759.1 fibro-slime domain-containing protein [Allomyces macrogynus ATCC 38327]